MHKMSNNPKNVRDQILDILGSPCFSVSDSRIRPGNDEHTTFFVAKQQSSSRAVWNYLEACFVDLLKGLCLISGAGVDCSPDPSLDPAVS